MATLKTTRTDASVDEFLDGLADEGRRRDARTVRDLMTRVTGEPGAMWGDAIVGFGERHLRYASGRELDWFVVGFSPRKQAITIYLSEGFDAFDDLLTRLGNPKTGKGCLYVKHVTDLDLDALRELIDRSVSQAGG
ncbi:uncharacterized protein DUF1801 [Krasilnikovia cinnamomea]|uniref:Uncharacterized protein DUF1801 n=1 Tax=Krasilnikovia cinnamomea TaxID=349313 RepID=A0A4Q7ZGR9_9ACTN|nr:DUF1801 domain-containing protein [Krasilnikovia cinnamomea]RZU49383.1 uncharacterized protein DUF1801 [Krasilnikovia cinnamomea]